MFKIGDFSKIARVSTRLLHYYDSIGLLRPQHPLQLRLAGERAGAAADQDGSKSTASLEEMVAFARSQGVVQVNQTAGVGNTSVNAVVLQLPGGAQ